MCLGKWEESTTGGQPGKSGGGAFMEPFMTRSLMLSVPGQQAPESSESEINEGEPQQSARQERSV